MHLGAHKQQQKTRKWRYISKELLLLREQTCFNNDQTMNQPKKMSELQKSIKYKNKKDYEEIAFKKVKKLNNNDLDNVNPLEFDSDVDKQVQACQRPVWQKNLLKQLESSRYRSTNTEQLYQIHYKIKKTAYQATSLNSFYLKKFKTMENQDARCLQINLDQELDRLLKQITFQSKKDQLQNIKFNQLEQFDMENIEIYSKKSDNHSKKSFQNIFLDFLRKKKSFPEFKNSLSQTLTRINLSVKQCFMENLISQIFEKIQAKNVSEKGCLNDSVELNTRNYFNYYTKTDNSISYRNIYRKGQLNNQVGLSFQEKNSQIHKEKLEGLKKWCRYLMLFFSQKSVEQILQKQLTENDQKLVLKSIKQFYKTGKTQNQSSLKARLQYESNVFYRILVKILLDQPLSETEMTNLFDEQKDVIIYIKLKYIPEFHKTIEFLDVKNNLYANLRKAINQNDLKLIKKLTQKAIHLLTFDELCYKFLFEEQKIPEFQLLCILKIILQNPKLLELSLHSTKQWILFFIQMLQRNIKNTKVQNFSTLGIELLEVCREFYSPEEYCQKFKELLSCNKFFFLKFLSQNSAHRQIITNVLNLQLSILDPFIYDKIDTYDELNYLIKAFLSEYIDWEYFQFELNSHPNKSIAEKNIYLNKTANFKTKLKNRQHQNKMKLTYQQIQDKNTLFLIGIKLILKFFIKIYTEQSQYRLSDDLGLFYRHNQLLCHLTKVICSQLKELYELKNYQKIKTIKSKNKQNNESEDEAKILQAHLFVQNLNQILFVIDFFKSYFEFENQNNQSEVKKINQFCDVIIKIKQLDGDLQEGLKILTKMISEYGFADKTFVGRLLTNLCDLLLYKLKIIYPDRNAARKKDKASLDQRNKLDTIHFLGVCLKMIDEVSGKEERLQLGNLKNKLQEMNKILEIFC